MALDTLGGYRILRKIGEGPRAEVFLAHPDRPGADPGPVVLKVHRAGVPDEAIFTEIEALSRSAGAHVVELIDIASGEGGAPVLVLGRLAGPSLARLLADRGALRCGEAVTILAPIAIALNRAHSAGVVHGGLRAASVLFDGAGTPTLAGFGSASLIEPGLPPAKREESPGFAEDLHAFAALCATVLVRTPAGADAIGGSSGSSGWLAAASDRLFDLSAPEAVDVSVGAARDPVDYPVREVLSRNVLVEPDERPQVPPWIQRFVPAEIGDALPGALQRARSLAATVRRPVWIAAGAALVGLVAALLLVPSSSHPGPIAEPTASPVPSAIAGPVGADDPVAATTALLELRQRCIRDLSVLCLDGVDQPGSGALVDDVALIRGIQGGAELPATPATANPELVERLGDSAIVAVGTDAEPASVLLMKGEAGWRIRDYLEG